MSLSIRDAALCLLSGIVLCGAARAQATAPLLPPPPPVEPSAGVLYRSTPSLEALAKQLMAAAKGSPTGYALSIMDRTPTQYTELITRLKSGGGELHKTESDLFIVIDGEAVVYTGGKVIDPRDTAPNEIRGTSVEGGTPQALHKGDLLMVAPNVAHQTTIAPGKTFTYIVVKVISK